VLESDDNCSALDSLDVIIYVINMTTCCVWEILQKDIFSKCWLGEDLDRDAVCY